MTNDGLFPWNRAKFSRGLFAFPISATRTDNGWTGIRVTSQVSVSLLDRSVSLWSKCGERGGRLKKGTTGTRYSSSRKCAWLAKAHAALLPLWSQRWQKRFSKCKKGSGHSARKSTNRVARSFPWPTPKIAGNRRGWRVHLRLTSCQRRSVMGTGSGKTVIPVFPFLATPQSLLLHQSITTVHELPPHRSLLIFTGNPIKILMEYETFRWNVSRRNLFNVLAIGGSVYSSLFIRITHVSICNPLLLDLPVFSVQSNRVMFLILSYLTGVPGNYWSLSMFV